MRGRKNYLVFSKVRAATFIGIFAKITSKLLHTINVLTVKVSDQHAGKVSFTQYVGNMGDSSN